ncbi:MAG: AAC(3) family N-acetyltransferase [Flavobacteriia bacterium]|nr:AAC(3) family N-acetyltransferase [Flavobacteriia bacterium]
MNKIPSEIAFENIPFQLDILPSDIVFISADFKNIAYALKKKKLTVNIDKFINHLQTILTNGTIVIPAYTDNLKTGGIFNYLTDKPTTGSVSNRVYKRKDFIRSKDPLHSVFAWGKENKTILHLQDKSTFGPNSIYAFLHRQNAKFIFIDVHIENSFTFVHYVEENLKVKHRQYKRIHYTLIDENNNHSNKEILFFAKKKGILNDFKQLNLNLNSKNIMHTYLYHDIPIQICSAKEAYSEIERTIVSNEKVHRFNFKTFIKDFLHLKILFFSRLLKWDNQRNT